MESIERKVFEKALRKAANHGDVFALIGDVLDQTTENREVENAGEVYADEAFMLLRSLREAVHRAEEKALKVAEALDKDAEIGDGDDWALAFELGDLEIGAGTVGR